jgi:hypothetical protein
MLPRAKNSEKFSCVISSNNASPLIGGDSSKSSSPGFCPSTHSSLRWDDLSWGWVRNRACPVKPVTLFSWDASFRSSLFLCAQVFLCTYYGGRLQSFSSTYDKMGKFAWKGWENFWKAMIKAYLFDSSSSNKCVLWIQCTFSAGSKCAGGWSVFYWPSSQTLMSLSPSGTFFLNSN